MKDGIFRTHSTVATGAIGRKRDLEVLYRQ
jgi:hypothetical protein